MIKVYVAGPYTKGDREANVRRAITAGNHLRDLGFAPFVPHIFHFWDAQHPRDYESWIDLDMVWLAECQAMLRIPGESPGADREERRCGELGIPVFRSIDALLSWAALL